MSVTIPNLPTAESVASTDYVVVETSGGTKKANVSQIKPTMDNAPTSGSSNPVTSDGIYTAVHGTKPLTEGGTGATSASDARTNLGLGGAAVKAVDTSITAASQSANVPTSEAVAAFVEGKGYLTQAPVTSVNGQTGAVNITAISFHILQVNENLPVTGVLGGIYFKPNGNVSGTNLYDEWVDVDGQGSWENLGPVEVNLTSYTQFTDLATAYDSTETYDTGEVVSYNNGIYFCIVAVTEPEEFDSSKWTEVEVMSAISAWIASLITSLGTAAEANTTTTISTGSTDLPTAGTVKSYVDGKSPTTANATMAAASWDGTTKVYSFETSYPSSTYDIEAVLPQESATDDQRKALSKADISGYYSTNIVKAHGTVPEIDIPVTLVIRAK